MIRYTSIQQLTIEGFETPFENTLSADNRWVKLSKVVPWDKFANIYIQKMRKDFGRPGISPRMVLGALIIKHMEKLDDRSVIHHIQENIYMQYFVGLSSFTSDPIFDPSLFVEIRKRIGLKDFDELNKLLLQSVSETEDQRHIKRHSKKNQAPKSDNKTTHTESKNQKNKGNKNPSQKIPNKGKMQMDATVADQNIKYPTDTDLLRTSIKQCEKIIDKLYEIKEKKGVKPRTYRRVLDKFYLSYSKKRRKSKASIRKANHKFLEALNRDIKHINRMLDEFETFPLTPKEQKMLWVVSIVYAQQKEMYDKRTNSCSDRIVNIHQPHVRPIVRGKQGSQVEFGSKLGVSLNKGIARIDTLSWNAYNESKDLRKQVEEYYKFHGFYPELVQVDKIYATRENRAYLKERGIRITAPPLGRKRVKEPETPYQKRKRKQEAVERNQIEGKFGQGKNGYNLNNIRAYTRATSESWVACIFFVMNLLAVQKFSFLLSNSMQFFLKYVSEKAIRGNLEPFSKYFQNTRKIFCIA